MDDEFDSREGASLLSDNLLPRELIGGTFRANPVGAFIDQYDLLNPPVLNAKSDQPLLRTHPLQPQEVLRIASDSARKERTPYADFSKRYDQNKPISFYSGLLEGASDLGPETIERYDPPRGLKERSAKAVKKKGVANALMRLAEKGSHQKDWYKTKPLLSLYKKELGDEKGIEKFIKDIKIFSATSAGADVESNVKMSSYYQYLAEQGLPIEKPEKGSGYGSMTADTQLKAVKEYLDQGDIDPIENPKRYTFTSNFLGQEDYVTSDRHNMRTIGMLSKDPEFLKRSFPLSKESEAEKYRKMGFEVTEAGGKYKKKKINPYEEYQKGTLTMKQALKMPTLWVDAPAKTEYKGLEDLQKKLAKKMGMTPAEFQASVWFGAGEQTGVRSPTERFIDTVEKRVRYTAEILGTDPKVVLKQYIRGEIPLADITDMNKQYGGLIG